MGRQQSRTDPPAIQPAPEHRSRHAGRRGAGERVSSRRTDPHAAAGSPIGAKTILEDHDDAWIDLQDEIHWVHEGREFFWLSERDGWRHLYLGGRTGKDLTRVTSGDFDVIGLVAVDEAAETVYFMASPKNPTQRYLYRVKLDGKDLERVSPADQAGNA